MSFWEQIGLIFAGSAFSLFLNWMLLMWFFHWKQRAKVPDELESRLGRLEDAFIAHTGVTLNGKPYRRKEGS